MEQSQDMQLETATHNKGIRYKCNYLTLSAKGDTSRSFCLCLKKLFRSGGKYSVHLN